MDKFWVDKLGALKIRLKKHLAEKARFEAKTARSSLEDLRVGQHLKREEDQIASHFAQLAEFATGVPSEKYRFKLDLQSVYLLSRQGILYFGPSALSTYEPYVKFDPHKLFVRNQEEKSSKTTEPKKEKKIEPKKVTPPRYEKIISFTDQVATKHKLPLVTAITSKSIIKEKPTDILDRIDTFVEKVSSVGNYFDSIVNKYKPEPSASKQPSGLFIYVGDFVYLSRRGKWAKVKTTILTQKDYFTEKFISRPELAGKRPLRIEDGELEVADVAELITDDYAEPVASPTAELGLGYFIPTRRVGSSKPPQMDLKRRPAGIEKPVEGLPFLGSDEFVADIMQKAESSGQPVQEISPTYISSAGRKIDRARSFADSIRTKMQLPKSEPVRRAVESLLPALETIIQRTDTEAQPEEALLEVERSFDDLVAVHTQPFRVAQRATVSASEWTRTGADRMSRTFARPQEDSLGVIRKYLPEIASLARASLGLISTAIPAAMQARQIQPPLMAPQMQAIGTPALSTPSVTPERRESRAAQNLRSEAAAFASRAVRGMPGMLGTLSSMVSRSGIGQGLQSMIPGVGGTMPQMTGFTGMLGGAVRSASGFAQGLIGRTTGILGRVGSGLAGGLAQSVLSRRLPGGLSGVASGIGSLLSGGGSAGAGGFLGRAQSALSGLGDMVPSGGLGGLLGSGRSAVENLLGGGVPSSDSTSGAARGGFAGLTSGLSGASGLGGLLSSGTSRVGSLLSSAASGGLGRAVSGFLPGGAGGLLSRVTGGLSGLMGGQAEGLLSSITGGRGASALGGLGQSASSMASGLLARVGLPSTGRISQMASHALGGFTGGGSSPLGSLISGAGSVVSGLGGQGAGILSGLTGGDSGSGLLSGIGSRVSGMASGLGSRVTDAAASGIGSRVGEMASGLGERVMGMASGLGERVSSLVTGSDGGVGEAASGGIGGRLSSMIQGLAGGASSLVSRASSAVGGMGGIGSLAQRASSLSSSISGMAGRASQMTGGGGSPLSGIGAVGAALPRLSGMRSAAQGAVGSISSQMPSIGGMADIGSSASQAIRSADLPGRSQLPRGWDRPPFEVGDAIQRTIRGAVPEQIGALTRRAQSGLADYGLSVIDLDETDASSLRSPAQQLEEMSEVDIDEETMEAVYFRLRRIFETENERVGGDA
jgi:hypothetical protein